MDKNGVGVAAWGALGFGHAELGTVTAQAQPGNDRPRLFRLPRQRRDHQPDGLQQRRRPGAGRPAGRRRGRPGQPAGRHPARASRSARPRSSRWPRRPRTTSARCASWPRTPTTSRSTCPARTRPGLRSLQDADTLGELIKTLVAEAWRLADAGPAGADPGQARPRPDRLGARAGPGGVHGRRRGGPDRDQHHAEPGRARARPTRPARPRPAGCPGRR